MTVCAVRARSPIVEPVGIVTPVVVDQSRQLIFCQKTVIFAK